MGKLRHLAMTVPDPEATASFYEKTFGMHRVWEQDIGVMLSDGVVSLAILKFPTDEMAGDERGKDFHGIHHMGFVVDDLQASAQDIKDNGGRYHMQIPGQQADKTEQKYFDPNGVVFDIVNHEYATESWGAKP
jgi:catechol 2,3-dioxygenase-like lactoylglutathione lyase family enzyme